MAEVLTGGCQCGAVRFRVAGPLFSPHLCFCRMCQKATGNLFAALVGVRRAHLLWTRGEPATFLSSAHVERGFCRDCGTSLFYHNRAGEHVSLSIGAFDAPQGIAIAHLSGMEGKHPSLDRLAELPTSGTTESEDPEWAAAIARSSRQHPDHDTADWPPADRGQA